MTDAKHTTGPWHISEVMHGTFLMHDTYCVARLDSNDPQRLARVLATQAELVAALREITVALLPDRPERSYSDPLRDIERATEIACAAIRKVHEEAQR